MKLITKLTLLFILISILPLAISGYIAFQNGKETIEQQTDAHLLSISALKESEFNLWVNENRRALHFLAQRPLLRSNVTTLALSEKYSEDSAYQEALGHLVKDHLLPFIGEGSGLLEIFVVRISDGRILASTNKGVETTPEQDQAIARDHQLNPLDENLSFHKVSGADHMHFSTPVFGEDGLPIAVLIGHADLNEVSSIIEHGIDHDRREESYLINADNYLVTNPRLRDDYGQNSPIYSSGVKDCLEGNSATGVYDNYAGMKVIGAYTWMPAHEMCLVTEVDQNTALILEKPSTARRGALRSCETE